MKTGFSILLLSVSMAVSAYAGEAAPKKPPGPTQKLASDLLRPALVELVSSEVGRSYFIGLNPEDIKVSHEMEIESTNGWIERWRFEKKLEYEANPQKGAQVLGIPVVHDPEGLLFEIAIFYNDGGASVWTQKDFDILGFDIMEPMNDLMYIGYTVVAPRDDAPLRKAVEEICLDIQKKLKPVATAEYLKSSTQRSAD